MYLCYMHMYMYYSYPQIHRREFGKQGQYTKDLNLELVNNRHTAKSIIIIICMINTQMDVIT